MTYDEVKAIQGQLTEQINGLLDTFPKHLRDSQDPAERETFRLAWLRIRHLQAERDSYDQYL